MRIFVLWFLCFFIPDIFTITLKNGNIYLNLEESDDGIAFSLVEKNIKKLTGTLAYMNELKVDFKQIENFHFNKFNDFTFNISFTSNGFKFQWETNNITKAFLDCINLGGNHVNWYGGPERIQADWPIEKLIISNDIYVSSKSKSGAISERYWLNSLGSYIYVDERVPLFVNQNDIEKGKLCFLANVSGSYEGRNRVLLSYTIASLPNAKEAHLHAVENYLGKPTGHPNPFIISKPIWTTWAKYKTKINDKIVLDFAKDIVSHGFNGQLEIDDMWEDCYGSTNFDTEKFPDIKLTVKELHKMNFTVTIWTHPFVNINCSSRTNEGLENGYFIKKKSDDTTLINWWNGDAYHIDFTNEKARNWYIERLKNIQNSYGIDSFKFDAGESDWAPQPSVLNTDIELVPNNLTSQYVRTCASFGDLVEVRSGWKTQDLPIFVRMIDKDSHWNNQNGLYTLITTLLQMNLNGYTLVLPDMIGGNGYNNTLPSAELLVRWTQANTFMPAMQFSYLPWDFKSNKFNVTEIVKKCLNLRNKYLYKILEAMNNSIIYGIPVNPPVWWVDPQNMDLLGVDDEFMLGEDILVAPIIKEGAIKRNIILPYGAWMDGNTGEMYQGPTTIKDYSAPIDILPYFLK